jgi:hypothetical protein
MLDVLFTLSQYEGQSFQNNPEDAILFKNKIQHTSVSNSSRVQQAVANGASNQAITLVNNTADYTAIATDQTVTIKVNGSATAMTLTPRAAGTKTFAFYVKGQITALTVSNASGSTANLDIVLINL